MENNNKRPRIGRRGDARHCEMREDANAEFYQLLVHSRKVSTIWRHHIPAKLGFLAWPSTTPLPGFLLGGVASAAPRNGGAALEKFPWQVSYPGKENLRGSLLDTRHRNACLLAASSGCSQILSTLDVAGTDQVALAVCQIKGHYIKVGFSGGGGESSDNCSTQRAYYHVGVISIRETHVTGRQSQSEHKYETVVGWSKRKGGEGGHTNLPWSLQAFNNISLACSRVSRRGGGGYGCRGSHTVETRLVEAFVSGCRGRRRWAVN